MPVQINPAASKKEEQTSPSSLTIYRDVASILSGVVRINKEYNYRTIQEIIEDKSYNSMDRPTFIVSKRKFDAVVSALRQGDEEVIKRALRKESEDGKLYKAATDLLANMVVVKLNYDAEKIRDLIKNRDVFSEFVKGISNEDIKIVGRAISYANSENRAEIIEDIGSIGKGLAFIIIPASMAAVSGTLLGRALWGYTNLSLAPAAALVVGLVGGAITLGAGFDKGMRAIGWGVRRLTNNPYEAGPFDLW